MRFIITGGGTGGHIYPALAITQGLKERYPGAEFLYVGTSKGLEADIVPKAGLPFVTVCVEGLARPISLRTMKSALKAFKGGWQALGVVRRFKPDVVVGTGGYVCGPVVLAAAIQGIPTMIHEQNAVPGITNRILSRFTSAVCTTFEDSVDYFPKKNKVFLTGLPVRPEILKAQREKAFKDLGLKSGKTTILITGGSRGARNINLAVVPVLKKLSSIEKLQFYFITGQAVYEETLQALKKAGINWEYRGNIKVTPYLYQMENALAAADLIIGRAGASFLSEIMLRGIPSVLVPYSYAAANHQEFNARALERRNAAKVILDRELTGETLVKIIEDLIKDLPLRNKMADAALKMGKENALKEIVDVVAGISRTH